MELTPEQIEGAPIFSIEYLDEKSNLIVGHLKVDGTWSTYTPDASVDYTPPDKKTAYFCVLVGHEDIEVANAVVYKRIATATNELENGLAYEMVADMVSDPHELYISLLERFVEMEEARALITDKEDEVG